ncbi:MAG TPA: DUF4203 domain-containing protein [Chthoniobacterales bacterium]|jgi:hypothetical protein|nr:DUF4203 domain-containing protein [Chthoniobacterales bacterium]
MNFSVPIISVLVGLALLLFGRRLFWLFVAALGFALGLELAPYLSHNPPLWLSLVLSLGLGLIGALVAFLLQKLAIGIAGFLVGGRIALALAAAFLANHAHYSTITFVIGGVIGAILLLVLFDWALIIFSSIEGARLIAEAVHLPSSGTTVLVVVLAIFGILVQAMMFGSRQRRRPI